MRRLLTVLLTFFLATSIAGRAHAYTTRVHIAYANAIRQMLIESPDGRTIRLLWSPHSVQLPVADAEAIINEPLAFRAGAIGPDNVVFPAMTDGTHGVTQNPYRQCEMLYLEAENETERAYALGCFLHGASDAIAHHFVNHFTGETFTLNPISASREEDFDNVIGHIATEGIIQLAIHRALPEAFSGTNLNHAIAQDFVLRTYFNVDSPIWQRMAEEPLVKWDAARAADPNGNVLSWARNAGFAPWEQLAMAPLYIDEMQRLREGLRTTMTSRIATLGTMVGATAGSDGVLHTQDDDTTCSATCSSAFAEYFVLIRLLAPRSDTTGPLPSAFDTISDRLGQDLYGFLPALVDVIARTSRVLNAPITPGDLTDHAFDLNPAVISEVFTPIDEWATRTLNIDYELLGQSVSPEWYSNLATFLNDYGVNISIPDLLAQFLRPLTLQIRAALIDEVKAQAQAYLLELSAEYRASFEAWRTHVTTELAASAPSALGGHALEYVLESGLVAYSVNIIAATFANHEVLLVAGESLEHGPTSFDASYTMSWSQLGLCDYLRDAVFPAGTDLRALLSVEHDGMRYLAIISEDAPVECHDGALNAFGTPSVLACGHTDLPTLLTMPRGSLSRAFPPTYGGETPLCRDLVVPGLPAPPPRPDAGMRYPDGGIIIGADGGMTGGIDGSTDPGPDGSGGSGGCCSVAPGASGEGSTRGMLAFALLGLAGVWRLSRRRAARMAVISTLAIVTALGLSACGEAADGEPGDADAGQLSGSDAGGSRMDGSTHDAGHDHEHDGGGSTGDDTGVEPDAGQVDAGAEVRSFLSFLGESVWSSLQTRMEGPAAVQRAYEMRFRSRDLLWGEIRNPFGPARQRVLRQFRVTECVSDRECTVSSTIMIPTGWETPEPLRGRRENWTFELTADAPRILTITNSVGEREMYSEGAVPAPNGGLTADVRVFGSTGPIFNAYCGSSSSDWSGQPIWDFARGRSGTLPLRRDVVAGVQIGEWRDSATGRFSVRDIQGFERLGGTELSDQANFVARFFGTISHTGHLSLRERDDDVDNSAFWVFTGGHVGTGGPGEHLLQIFSYIGFDDDVVTLAGLTGPGDLAVEVIVVWCSGAGVEPFTLEASLTSASGPWQIFGAVPAQPMVNADLFPAVL